MDKQALARELNDLLATERRSLLEHFMQATPHVDAKTYRHWNEIKRLAHRDTDHAARLSSLLSKLHLPERPRPFSQLVGHYHYMSLDRVIDLLIDEKRGHLAAYDRAIRHCAGESEVVLEIESLRADNLAELLVMESIAKALKLVSSRAGQPDPALSPDVNNAANAAVAAKALAAVKAK